MVALKAAMTADPMASRTVVTKVASLAFHLVDNSVDSLVLS